MIAHTASQEISRRMLLRGAVALPVIGAFGGRLSAATRASSPEPMGLASLTVMEPLARDDRGTFRALHAIGYRNIETIGTLGTSAGDLKRKLQEAGLRTTSQHLTPSSFYPQMLAWSRGQASLPDTLAKLDAVYDLERINTVLDEGIAAAHALEQSYLVWSYLPRQSLESSHGMCRLIEVLDRAGRRCRAEGLKLAFHNGSKGFNPISGIKPYDMLLRESNPAHLAMELDVYWMSKVGGDPIEYLKAHSGRFPMLHLKDMSAAGAIVGLGEGTLDFRAILAAARASGASTVFFEYDQAPDALSDARRAFKHYETLIA